MDRRIVFLLAMLLLLECSLAVTVTVNKPRTRRWWHRGIWRRSWWSRRRLIRGDVIPQDMDIPDFEMDDEQIDFE
uniref:Uncharacterized LOC100178462 n=1 Tax=Ciona intestinalis TaxID=7719 RepID=F6SEL7_CIOIN